MHIFKIYTIYIYISVLKKKLQFLKRFDLRLHQLSTDGEQRGFLPFWSKQEHFKLTRKLKSPTTWIRNKVSRIPGKRLRPLDNSTRLQFPRPMDLEVFFDVTSLSSIVIYIYIYIYIHTLTCCDCFNKSKIFWTLTSTLYSAAIPRSFCSIFANPRAFADLSRISLYNFL